MNPGRGQILLWTGSYTGDSGGAGAGIGAATVTPDGRLKWEGTAADSCSPSFIAVHPSLPMVYAVGEFAQTLQAYRREGDAGLATVGELWRAGAAACHVAVDPRGRFVVIACWGDGQVLLFELNDGGGITSRLPAAASVDPHGGERQSRAHASLMLADGRIMTTDLGHDLLRVWQYAPGYGLILDHEVVLPKDSGPRHLVQHPEGTVFVVSEYTIEAFALQASSNAGRFELVSHGPATTGGAQAGDCAAHIALSPDGRHAYVGVRGSNRISVLAVDGMSGQFRPLADCPSGGDWPRHHLVRDGWLHVAHERSHEVTTFPLDPESGLPGQVHDRLSTGSPTALVEALS